MKMRNGFFSFSMTALAVLTLSLAMTTALLAVSSLQMVAIYEKKVRLHYLADSAVREGWQEVQQNPLPYFQRHAVAVPQSAQLLRQYMHNTEIAVTMRLSTILKTIKQPL